MSLRLRGCRRPGTLAALAMIASMAAPALAQEPTETNLDRITFEGGIDLGSAYMFRGILQDDTGTIGRPYGSLQLSVYSGSGGLRNVGVQVGWANSLHTGVAGSDGPSGKLWYESDVYASVGVTLGRLGVGTTYTAYTSPNEMFTTVKEISIRVSVDDRSAFGGAAVRPHALVAFELDAKPGVGQVDGGLRAGKYLELGITPGYAARVFNINFPVKLGFSLEDYYELAGEDHMFGYISVGGMATMPIGRATSAGSWNVHGGLEYQALGDTTRAFNRGDRSNIVGSVGIGVSY